MSMDHILSRKSLGLSKHGIAYCPSLSVKQGIKINLKVSPSTVTSTNSYFIVMKCIDSHLRRNLLIAFWNGNTLLSCNDFQRTNFVRFMCIQAIGKKSLAC